MPGDSPTRSMRAEPRPSRSRGGAGLARSHCATALASAVGALAEGFSEPAQSRASRRAEYPFAAAVRKLEPKLISDHAALLAHGAHHLVAHVALEAGHEVAQRRVARRSAGALRERRAPARRSRPRRARGPPGSRARSCARTTTATEVGEAAVGVARVVGRVADVIVLAVAQRDVAHAAHDRSGRGSRGRPRSGCRSPCRAGRRSSRPRPWRAPPPPCAQIAKRSGCARDDVVDEVDQLVGRPSWTSPLLVLGRREDREERRVEPARDRAR